MHFLDLCRHPAYINEQFPISATIDRRRYPSPKEVSDWLDRHLGVELEGWILKGPNIYGFKTEQDKLVFALRWA